MRKKILKAVSANKSINDEVRALEESIGTLLIGYKDKEEGFIWLRENDFMNSPPEFVATKVKKLSLDKKGNLWFSGNEQEFNEDAKKACEKLSRELKEMYERNNKLLDKHMMRQLEEDIHEECFGHK